MKTVFLTLILLLGFEASATHWLTYYIYTESEYIQGPWKQANTIEKYKSKYLQATPHEGLFGTGEQDFLNQILNDLRKVKPSRYKQDIRLDSKNDTVLIRIAGPIQNKESLFNEMTASYTANGYNVVQFDINDSIYLKTWKDLTLPYMDLVDLIHTDTNQNQIDNELEFDSIDLENPSIQEKETLKNERLAWYTKISIGLNILLILYLLFKNIIRPHVKD
ncbi:MAG: hypothetical protein R2852_02665 [Bacteroidia bacterium]